MLSRLVELNKKRAVEEAVGNIRWLRPEYQIPRFGSDAEKARLAEEKRQAREAERLRPRQGALELQDDLREMMPKGGKPDFPTGDELAETAAVMSVLATTAVPLSIDAIAQRFSQGMRVKRRVELTVLALARLGHLASADGGETFTLRRAA